MAQGKWKGGGSIGCLGARIVQFRAYKKADSLATFFKESSIIFLINSPSLYPEKNFDNLKNAVALVENHFVS